MILQKLRDLLSIITEIEGKIGFKKFIQYILIGLVLVLIVDYENVLKSVIEKVSFLEDEIHNQKLELRDELLVELYPILSEFRAEVGADRVLYFEYHNSKENLVSIPFKYIELVQQSTRYSIPNSPSEMFRNINTGAITTIYEDIKGGNVIFCYGLQDLEFRTNYPGVFELVNSRDNSKMLAFISIPGIDQSIGLIILEWMSSDISNDKDIIDEIEITELSTRNFIPRINALILSKTIK